MFRYESVNSTRKFTIVAEIVSLLKKVYKRDAPFRAVFKVKTLAVLFSAYPSEMKHIPRNLNLPPFCRCLFLWKWCNPFPRARARLKHAHSFDRCGRSAILVLPHTQNIAGGKISGFEGKAFTRQNFPDSKVFGFKVPTLDSGFKISGDMTKPGCFHFGFVLLCVNGKTNPVLKRFGFITNPEQFPLV